MLSYSRYEKKMQCETALLGQRSLKTTTLVYPEIEMDLCGLHNSQQLIV